MAKYDIRGAIHLHSTFSDGHGEIAEIMTAANEAGLDFVLLTDHDCVKAADEGEEKWHDSSLLVVGTEITPRHNHYIAVGPGKLKGLESLNEKKPQQIIDHVKKEGWAGFIAHPDHKGTKRFSVESYEWQDWEVDGYTGMSIWDLMSDWQGQLDGDDVTMDFHTNFQKYLKGPNEATIKRWDALNQTRKVVAIGEIDNHKKTKEFDGQQLVIFPYDVAFKTIQNHVLLDDVLSKDPKKAKKQIVDALAHGSSYVSFDWWNDPTDFTFDIEEGDSAASMGDSLELKSEAEIIVSLPEQASIKILRDGETFWEGEGDEALVTTSTKGAYRVEAHQNGLAWILSNPIYVK